MLVACGAQRQRPRSRCRRSARDHVDDRSGDVWLGAVQSDVRVRTGSGDLTVADAACG